MTDQVPLELVGVRIELPTNTPIVLLRERDGVRFLPIWIGTAEATAIALELEGVRPMRPMTHDLLRNVIEALGATVDRVVVTELREGTFYAELLLETGGGDRLVISSRPSDAIALAVRTGSPIYAVGSLLDEAGVEIHDESEEEEIERFREFLDQVTPEDFEAGNPS
ncbi:MAG TPA: bifunctional nuclease family protein [Actinobacteria bacterium]|nr:bifunctional nuclease family protein [Actinomycetota bacterium]